MHPVTGRSRVGQHGGSSPPAGARRRHCRATSRRLSGSSHVRVEPDQRGFKPMVAHQQHHRQIRDGSLPAVNPRLFVHDPSGRQYGVVPAGLRRRTVQRVTATRMSSPRRERNVAGKARRRTCAACALLMVPQSRHHPPRCSQSDTPGASRRDDRLVRRPGLSSYSSPPW